MIPFISEEAMVAQYTGNKVQLLSNEARYAKSALSRKDQSFELQAISNQKAGPFFFRVWDPTNTQIRLLLRPLESVPAWGRGGRDYLNQAWNKGDLWLVADVTIEGFVLLEEQERGYRRVEAPPDELEARAKMALGRYADQWEAVKIGLTLRARLQWSKDLREWLSGLTLPPTTDKGQLYVAEGQVRAIALLQARQGDRAALFGD